MKHYKSGVLSIFYNVKSPCTNVKPLKIFWRFTACTWASEGFFFQGEAVMVYCFIWLSQQAEAPEKAMAPSKPTISEHLSKWKCNGVIADQYKQKGVLCHIGLVRVHGGHLVNQPSWSLFEKCWKTTVENQISTIRKTNKHKPRWRKCIEESACQCTQMSGSNLIEGLWCG